MCKEEEETYDKYDDPFYVPDDQPSVKDLAKLALKWGAKFSSKELKYIKKYGDSSK